MSPVIPVHMEEVPSGRGRYRNRMTFVIPSLESEFSIEFVPSKTGTAIKRLMTIIDMEIAGAEKSALLDKLETFVKPGVNGTGRTMSADELAEFRRVNGWLDDEPAVEDVAPSIDDIIDDPLLAEPLDTPADMYCRAVESLQPVPTEIAPAPVEPVAPAEVAPVVTSDGRYIVDPVARTIEPVADIPADIVAIMPVWDISPDMIEFWPRSFDIAPEMEGAFGVEQEAAAALLIELGGIIWGACSTDIALDALGNTARLIDSGKIIGPAGSYPAAARPVGGA